MSKCNRCNIEILDKTLSCPLCKNVLYIGNDNTKDAIVSKSIMYPDITPVVKKIKFVFKLVVFCCILIEAALIVINYVTAHTISWSLICGVAMLYLCFSFIYSFKHKASHRTKMMIHTIAVMICSILIDLSIGYSGWSIDFALPCSVLVLDGAIIVLLITNINNWQSYILLEIFALLLSIILFVLTFFGLFSFKLLAYIAALVSILIFAGTLTFGEKRATNELKRRFHV